MAAFTCRVCGNEFSLPQHVLDRYPGWNPQLCTKHRATASAATPEGSRPRRGRSGTEKLMTPTEVLDRYSEGPLSGVFTDGASVPNPGPGGWGAVYAVDDQVVAERHGRHPDTTNNRMELTALIEGVALVPGDTPATVYSDSRVSVRTITEWAEGWERRGWKRKSGPVENLDLVKGRVRGISGSTRTEAPVDSRPRGSEVE